MHINNYAVDNMCDVLEISKRTYYKYRAAEDKDYYDYLLIKEVFDESKGTYGYRRICEGFWVIMKLQKHVIFSGRLKGDFKTK